MTGFSEFSKGEMIKELKAFDPISFKYYYGESPEEIKKRIENSTDEAKRYARIVEYEKSQQFSGLTKRNYADDCANLNLVYGQQEETLDNINMLELVLNKLISQYINIDGMERLFSETYIEFEWEMHLSADYKKHDMKFYRDHFFHQVRDAHMMYILLRDQGFYEHIKEVLLNGGESKVSRFVCRNLKQQEYQENEKVRNLRITRENGKEKEDEDFYIRNMIYMACFMAGLFHDIGYPEAYYMTTSQHIKDYIASIHELNAGGNGIGKIYALLQNSLLFRVEPFSNIEKRLSNPNKPEHGTLSAIIFLLHFYENGAIYRLPPYKSAAVELAALAIYNHTNKYGILEEKGYDVYRSCFSLNPISYLLRVCDDLQEWDRIYFVISNKSGIVFCNTCKTPVVGYKEYINGEWITRYRCNCKKAVSSQPLEKEVDDKKQDLFLRAFDGSSKFSYRRIYNISVCDRIDVENKGFGRKLLFKLHYDPYKLLHVAYLNPTYAKERISELNKLKKFFECQKHIPQIFLDYFVTSNPVHIKVRLLEEYLEYRTKTAKEDEAESFVQYNTAREAITFEDQEKFEDWRDETVEEISRHISVVQGQFMNCLPKEKRVEELQDDPYDRLKEYIDDAMKFYATLLVYQWANQYLNDYIKKSAAGVRKETHAAWRKILLKSEWEFGKPYFNFPEIRCMITDCFLQFTRMYPDVCEFDFFPEEYYEQYENGEREAIFEEQIGRIYHESEEYYYKALVKYLDAELYVPIMKRSNKEQNNTIDAYTDLFIFYLMDREMKKK